MADDILRQYQLAQNPLLRMAQQDMPSPLTAPTINPAPPMPPMASPPLPVGKDPTLGFVPPKPVVLPPGMGANGAHVAPPTPIGRDILRSDAAQIEPPTKQEFKEQIKTFYPQLAPKLDAEDAKQAPRAPVATGPQLIKGGWVHTRDPETEAMFKNAQEQGMRAVDNTDEKFAAREANLDLREGQYKMAQAYADEAAKQKAQYDAQTDDANNKAAAAQRTDEEWRAVQNDLQSSKVDPNRYWSNMGAGNKVTSIFGALLGGFAQGFGRTGSNQFMDMLNHEIDKDVAQQEAQVAKKKDYASTLYGRFLQQTGDADKARALARATLAEVSKMTLASKEKLAQDDVAKAQLAQTLGALDARKQDELAAVSLRNAQINQAGMAQVPDRIVGGGPGGAGIGKAAEQSGLYVPALGGNARSDKEAQSLRESTAAIQRMQENLKRAAELRGQISQARAFAASKSDIFKTPEYRELQAITNDIRNDYSLMKGQGVVREHEVPQIDATLGSLTDWTQSGEEASKLALSQAERFGKTMESLKGAYGITPAQEAIVTDPRTGLPTRINVISGQGQDPRLSTPPMPSTVKRQ